MSIPWVVRVRYEGMERVPMTGPALLVSNHQSYLDPVLIGMWLPRACHFMARESLFRNPLFGPLIRSVNAFPVRRGEADITAIKAALRLLRRGGVLMAFPEGTRSTDGRVAPLKPGAVAAGLRCGVPIQPAVIEGLLELWPRGRVWPRWGTCWVQYGEPIPGERFRGRRPDEVTAELTTLLRGMHNRLRRRVGRRPFNYNDEDLPAPGASGS